MIIYSPLAGNRYRGIEASVHVANLDDGAPLSLVREPTNEFDVNAIKVISADIHVGYIPAKIAAKLAPLVDSNSAMLLAVWRPDLDRIEIDVREIDLIVDPRR